MCWLCVFFVPDYVEWSHFFSWAQFTGAHTQQKTLHRWHIHGVPFAYQNSLNVNREICGHMLRSISSSQHTDMCFMCILTYQYSCSAACGYETTQRRRGFQLVIYLNVSETNDLSQSHSLWFRQSRTRLLTDVKVQGIQLHLCI